MLVLFVFYENILFVYYKLFILIEKVLKFEKSYFFCDDIGLEFLSNLLYLKEIRNINRIR